MRYERRVLVLFCAVWVGTVTAAAWAGSVRTVCASGCEFGSLQAAVDSSEWGATIELGPGVYVENVVVRGEVTIRGAGADWTIVDGGSRDAALRLEGPLAYRVRLEDLTIRSGYRGWTSSGTGEVSLERCIVREAVGGSARLGSRGVAGRTDPIAVRPGEARRSERGDRSTAPNVSSVGEQISDALSGAPSGVGPSEISSTTVSSGEGATLCHIPPGDPENATTIVVGQPAVAAHLAHGDSLGACPEACNGVPSPVARTGQSGCWEEISGAPIPCAGTGQDGEYQTGVSVDPRFTVNQDGTVTDNLTGLVWLQNSNCFGRRTWIDALSDANTLADGSCGLTDGSVAGDWRLPNVRELQSLIDFGTYNPALPVGHPFYFVQFSNYWSSTSQVRPGGFAWNVALSAGYVSSSIKANTFYFWPIRGGQ